jgi:hypothetical protein
MYIFHLFQVSFSNIMKKRKNIYTFNVSYPSLVQISLIFNLLFLRIERIGYLVRDF